MRETCEGQLTYSECLLWAYYCILHVFLVRNRAVFSGLIELFVFSWRIIKLGTKTPSFYDSGFLTVAQVTNVSVS